MQYDVHDTNSACTHSYDTQSCRTKPKIVFDYPIPFELCVGVERVSCEGACRMPHVIAVFITGPAPRLSLSISLATKQKKGQQRG